MVSWPPPAEGAEEDGGKGKSEADIRGGRRKRPRATTESAAAKKGPGAKEPQRIEAKEGNADAKVPAEGLGRRSAKAGKADTRKKATRSRKK